MQQVRVATRNIDQAILFDGSLGADFRSKVADLKEMTQAFVQVFYQDNDNWDGTFELWISGFFCGDDEVMARYPCSVQMLDSGCKSLGWNLIAAGYRFVQVRYTAGSVTTGTCKVKAIGKKG